MAVGSRTAAASEGRMAASPSAATTSCDEAGGGATEWRGAGVQCGAEITGVVCILVRKKTVKAATSLSFLLPRPMVISEMDWLLRYPTFYYPLSLISITVL